MPQSPTDFRLYLCSSLREMAAEREYLHAVVFPEVPRRWERRGVRITVVDLRQGAPAVEEAEGAAGLAHALEEIDRCRPWFLCLLGSECGPVLDHYPEAAVNAYLWLSQEPPASRLELEVRRAIFWPGPPSAGLVYLRDPSFLDRVPERQRQTFLSKDAEFAGRMERLRSALTTGRRRLLRTYSPVWDEKGVVAGLKAFGEQVLADLELAISTALQAAQLSPAAVLADLELLAGRALGDLPKQRDDNRNLEHLLES